MALVLFDIDGTLIDSRKLIVEAKRLAFSECGLPVPDVERMLSVVGLKPEEAFTVLLGEDGPISEIAMAYRRTWFATRAEPKFADTLFPGAAELIAGLSQSDHRLGIVTGQPSLGVQHLLQRENWQNLFCTIQTEDVARSKPHPEMVQRALAETGGTPDQTYVIGDTTFDIEMAVAANVHAIGVSWGYHKPETLLAAGAEVIVENMADIATILAAN